MDSSSGTAKMTKTSTITPTKGTKTTAATMQFNTLNNCDGNRNNDVKFMIHHQHQQQQQQQQYDNTGKIGLITKKTNETC